MSIIKYLRDKVTRKPFPVNARALRRCRVSYGQFGEDIFITSLLGYNKYEGVYVDVGCFHPIDFSNTYVFYQRGWRGLAIDPNPRWRTAWKKFRPGDQFINVAVAASEEPKIYLMDEAFPECNRLLSSPPETLASHESVITVPARPLSDIVNQYLPDTPIDFLNIDCEGYDLEVLKTFDFTHSPTVIAAEDSVVSMDSPLTMFLQSQGYICKSHIGLTKIFQIEK